MWCYDGKHLYYVSDCDGGVANIVKHAIDGERGELLANKPAPQAVTKHQDESVRSKVPASRPTANLSSTSAASDIWVYSVKQNKSRKLIIEVNADDKTNPEAYKTFTTGATEYVLSADESLIAFVVHGEIFLMGPQAAAARRNASTNHPAFDHGIALRAPTPRRSSSSPTAQVATRISIYSNRA